MRLAKRDERWEEGTGAVRWEERLREERRAAERMEAVEAVEDSCVAESHQQGLHAVVVGGHARETAGPLRVPPPLPSGPPRPSPRTTVSLLPLPAGPPPRAA